MSLENSSFCDDDDLDLEDDLGDAEPDVFLLRRHGSPSGATPINSSTDEDGFESSLTDVSAPLARTAPQQSPNATRRERYAPSRSLSEDGSMTSFSDLESDSLSESTLHYEQTPTFRARGAAGGSAAVFSGSGGAGGVGGDGDDDVAGSHLARFLKLNVGSRSNDLPVLSRSGCLGLQLPRGEDGDHDDGSSGGGDRRRRSYEDEDEDSSSSMSGASWVQPAAAQSSTRRRNDIDQTASANRSPKRAPTGGGGDGDGALAVGTRVQQFQGRYQNQQQQQQQQQQLQQVNPPTPAVPSTTKDQSSSSGNRGTTHRNHPQEQEEAGEGSSMGDGIMSPAARRKDVGLMEMRLRVAAGDYGGGVGRRGGGGERVGYEDEVDFLRRQLKATQDQLKVQQRRQTTQQNMGGCCGGGGCGGCGHHGGAGGHGGCGVKSGFSFGDGGGSSSSGGVGLSRTRLEALEAVTAVEEEEEEERGSGGGCGREGTAAAAAGSGGVQLVVEINLSGGGSGADGSGGGGVSGARQWLRPPVDIVGPLHPVQLLKQQQQQHQQQQREQQAAAAAAAAVSATVGQGQEQRVEPSSFVDNADLEATVGDDGSRSTATRMREVRFGRHGGGGSGGDSAWDDNDDAAFKQGNDDYNDDDDGDDYDEQGLEGGALSVRQLLEASEAPLVDAQGVRRKLEALDKFGQSLALELDQNQGALNACLEKHAKELAGFNRDDPLRRHRADHHQHHHHGDDDNGGGGKGPPSRALESPALGKEFEGGDNGTPVGSPQRRAIRHTGGGASSSPAAGDGGRNRRFGGLQAGKEKGEEEEGAAVAAREELAGARQLFNQLNAVLFQQQAQSSATTAWGQQQHQQTEANFGAFLAPPHPHPPPFIDEPHSYMAPNQQHYPRVQQPHQQPPPPQRSAWGSGPGAVAGNGNNPTSSSQQQQSGLALPDRLPNKQGVRVPGGRLVREHNNNSSSRSGGGIHVKLNAGAVVTSRAPSSSTRRGVTAGSSNRTTAATAAATPRTSGAGCASSTPLSAAGSLQTQQQRWQRKTGMRTGR